MQDLRDAFRGSLLGTAVGDAIGRPVQGWSAARIAREHGELRDPVGHPRGRTTGDTQMTIALAEWLLEHEILDGGELARGIQRRYDPDRNYGRTTADFLRRLKGGERWDTAASHAFARGSFGGGAAARIAPCALLFHSDRATLERVAETSALVTHCHPLGVAGAVLQARQIALALENHGGVLDAIAFVVELRSTTATIEFRQKLRAVEECLERRASAKTVRDRLGCNATALGSVSTALYCFLSRGQSLEEAIAFAVNLGGEAHSIGAMTGAIAGAFHGASAIPPRWLDALERGEEGREALERLADRLLDRWLSRKASAASSIGRAGS
ncbi:MAG: ADP-ribosylglycohydrolase family protein [Deltaproteobacteria bacterium]|nr:ADP-ribosylglycohydrolase family protein [Deltaproteobacteria bacterium]